MSSFFTFLNPFFDAIAWLLAFFYNLIPNYGVAIILLTVLMRLILFPLTAKQAKSMLAMQRIQPEIKKLQAKYKNDRQKLNEEMMKFYKENKVNPFGGCLPLIAQAPVFFALFDVLRKPQNYIPKSSSLYHAICGSSHACHSPHGLTFLGMDLSKSASDAHAGLVAGLPYFVLIGLLVITSYFQQQQMTRNQSAPNPQMQMIGKIMPVFFAFIAISLPAGVVIYFFISNLWQMGQQEVVFRRYGTADAPKEGGAIDAKSSEASGGGGLLTRLMKPADPEPNGDTTAAPNGESPDASKPKPKPAASRPSGQGRKRSNKKRRR